MKNIRQVFYDTNLSLLPYDNVKGLCKEIADYNNCCLAVDSDLRKFEQALVNEGYPEIHCMELAISEIYDMVVESYLRQNS
jgi:hypothetical protein